MSEAEKQRRLFYKMNRKKWMKVQAIILSILVLLALISSFVFYQFNKAYYINYTEKSDIDYRVLLKENDFYESQYAEEGKAYVTSLIDKVIAEFGYELYMDTENVNFEYSYRIDAILQVQEKNGAVIYEHIDELVPECTVETTGDRLVIGKQLEVDYATYNDHAERFVKVYDLDNTKSVLILQMHMDVIGACEEFSDDSSNAYVFSLNVPLSGQTVNMSVTSTVEEGDNQILACENELLKNVFMVLTIITGALVVLDAAFFIAFVYITRNDDINYEIKVNRILKNYKSFIQRINNLFETEGYQILMVNTFGEMLEIRDTIQSPILVYENEDKTCSEFLIPTNTKLLYVFEIKVDDYDEIYATEKSEETAEEPQAEEAEPTDVPEEPIEEVLVLEDVSEEKLTEALKEPYFTLEDIEYEDEIVEDVDEGVEIVDVVWPERERRSKLYHYDPNGEQVSDGDIVLVPTGNAAKNQEVIRRAAVAHGNHRVDPDTLRHPLKKIVAIVKRRAEDALSVDPNDHLNDTNLDHE